MRPRLQKSLLALALAFSANLLGSPTADAVIHQVDVGNFFFSPAKTVVNPGDTVRWTVVGGVHTSTSENDSPKSWNSGTLTNGMSYMVQFVLADGPGPFPYLCSFHPLTMMDTIFMEIPGEPTIYQISLNEAQANSCAGTGSPAIGTGTATLSGDETTLTVHIEHDVANAISGHIHMGDLCVEGAAVFTFSDATSPIDEVWNLSAADVQNLKDGFLYANIHSAMFPAGEIRGQLLLPPDYVCGDANGDASINLLDILYLIAFIYNSPPGPAPNPLEAGDANGDGARNLLDILYLIAALYNSPPGPAPVCP